MEKCDWNLQYFLELAQMWFKKKKNRRKKTNLLVHYYEATENTAFVVTGIINNDLNILK